MRITPITPIYTQWGKKSRPKPPTKEAGNNIKGKSHIIKETKNGKKR